MKPKLRQFVQNFVQARGKDAFPHLYIVDKQTGPYRSIQEALDAAEPCSLIKVSEGFYSENLVITKPVRIEPKNVNEEEERIGAVLLASSGIAIHIKLAEFQNECEITGLKISHSGNSENFLKKEILEHEHIMNIFSKKENIEQLQSQYVNRTTFSKVENIIVLLERGRARISNCILSLTYLVKSCNLVIPAIWIDKEGMLALRDCEIKGHGKKQTIGILSKLGTVEMKNCTLSNHTNGGLLIWGIKGNASRAINNLFENNGVGIHVVGEQFAFKVISNELRGNGVGIKVGLACEPQISRNLLSDNSQGISIISAFPIITLNKIEKSKLNGVHCKSYKKLLCRAEIRKNAGIVSNGLNGVLIEGDNNHSVVSGNLIAFNHQAGVRVADQAFPLISWNKIYKNYREGVLIVEETNAVVEHNQISHNIVCNLACGGSQSHHTFITENTISHSLGAGVNLVHSGRCLLSRNDISFNKQGVILTASHAHLRRNYIVDNSDNGVVVEDHSCPTLVENLITRNKALGVFFRKVGKTVVHSNIVVSNEIDMGMQDANKPLLDQLRFSNTIEGEVHYPEQLKCLII